MLQDKGYRLVLDCKYVRVDIDILGVITYDNYTAHMSSIQGLLSTAIRDLLAMLPCPFSRRERERSAVLLEVRVHTAPGPRARE
jgi:hypothetical protein